MSSPSGPTAEERSSTERRELLVKLLRERETARTDHPLSPGQRALWFLHRLAPDSAAYNIMLAVRVRPAPNDATVRAALQGLVERHSILRTTYPSESGTPVQRVHPSGAVDLATYDASGWTDDHLRARLDAESDLPFDLEVGPVVRVALFSGVPTGDVVLFVFHHIAIDFWSLDILGAEFQVLHQAAVVGEPAVLFPVKAQYSDFVRWQAATLAGPTGTRMLSYWREQLATDRPPLELPLDFPRPRVQTYRGCFHESVVTEALTAGLRRLANESGTTLYTVVLASFQVLLSRFTGQDDVAVGSPMLGRDRPELEGTVGYLINPVVLVGDLSGDPPFTELLAQAHKAVLGGLANQAYPFPLLVEHLRPVRDPSRSPLFQAALFWDKRAQAQGQSDGATTIELFASAQRGAPVELTLTVVETTSGLETVWLYNADLFRPTTIARMARHFEALLAGIVTTPEMAVSQLPLAAHDDRRRSTTTASPPPAPFEEVERQIASQAARTPNAAAVTCQATVTSQATVTCQAATLTYADLALRSRVLARRLRQLGVGPEVVVAIRLDRSVAMVVAMLGVLEAGGAYLPVDPQSPPAHVRFLLQDSGARVLLTDAVVDCDRRQETGEPMIVVVDSSGTISSETVEDGDEAGDHVPLEAGPGPDALAYVIYTSGSTGTPKGVQVTRGALAAFMAAMRIQPGIADTDVVLAVTTLAFDIAVLELLLPLTVGAHVVVAPREVTQDGERLGVALRTHAATIMQATPAGWRLLLESGWKGEVGLTALCGGEALPWALAERLVERVNRLWNLYGPTEATVWCAAYPVGKARQGATVPIGYPIPGVELHLLDEHRHPVPLGVPAELYIGGTTVARGYAGQPELTAAKFPDDPCSPVPGARLFRTGDRARRLEDGTIEFLGRFDDQVKINGYRIEPGEVESVLASHPAVATAVAVVREDPLGERRLVAYVVPRGKGPTSGDVPPAPRRAGWVAPSNGHGYTLPNGMAVVPHDPYQANAVFKEVFEDRTYLQHGITIGDGDVVFDVGANIGLFTLFAHAESPHATIYSFEPLPPNFERLRASVTLNGVDARLFPFGLADQPGRADFTFYPRLAALSGRYPANDDALVRSVVTNWGDGTATGGVAPEEAEVDNAVGAYLESETYGCELRTLSDVIDEHGIERIDLLKIDVEKSELDVLRGLRDEHWPRVDQISIEVHTRDLLDAILEMLEHRGFDTAYDRTVVVVPESEFIYMLYAVRHGQGRTPEGLGHNSSASPSSTAPTAAELRHFLRERLPGHLVPSVFVTVDSLPLTLSGKVNRRSLPAPAWESPDLDAQFESPRDGLESALAAMWSEVLGLARVGAHDNFFDLGGASLQTVRVATRAREEGIAVTPEMIFQYQTLRSLAEVIVARADDRLADDRGAGDRLPDAGDEMLGIIADSCDLSEAGSDAALVAAMGVTGNTVVESLGVYLPSRVVSTGEVLQGCTKPMVFPLEQMTGIGARRVVGDNEFSIDLAAAAVSECLGRSRHQPDDIDLVVCCNISRYDEPNGFSFEPGTAAMLRQRFGLVNALAFNLNNACAGIFTAINLVDSWLRSGAVERVLVVSGEYITHLTDTAQREIDGFMDPRMACLTVGDAGMAMVLERSSEPGVGFHHIDLYTLGRYSDLCIAKITDRDHGGAIMLTDAIRQTAVGVSHAVSHSTQVLADKGWPPEAFDHLVMHQTSETALREAMRAINRVYQRTVCTDENTVINLRDRGNTATTTHWVAIADRIAEGRLQRGDRVVFGISGSGQTIGTALYVFDDLPDRQRASPPPLPRVARAPSRRAVPRRSVRAGRVRVESVGLASDEHRGTSALELARIAVEDCLAHSGHDRSDVELLVYAGVYRDDFLCEPAMASMLAGRLCMNHDTRAPEAPRTLALDITTGAVGFLNACWAASEAILAGKYRVAMVATAEIENNRTARPDRLIGLRETGSALILERSGDGSTGFGRFVFRYRTQRLDAEWSTGRFDGHGFLEHHRAPDLHEAYLGLIEEAVGELLDLEGRDLAEVGAVLPPQTSPDFVTALAQRLGVSRRLLVDVSAQGDLFTSSLPYGLHQVGADARMTAGDLGLIITAGSGVSVGCALYHF